MKPLERALGAVDAGTAATLRRLVARSGIGRDGDAVQAYMAARMVWHLGRGPAPAPPRGVWRERGVAELAERRAWELVDGARSLLPPVVHEPRERAA